MSKELLSNIEKAKKLEKLSEQEKKDLVARDLEYKKNKEKLLARLEKEKDLSFLKSLVERGLIGVSTMEQVLSNVSLDSAAVTEIFTKLDEIETTHDIDTIFPKVYRVSREEYLLALENRVSRVQLLTKLDTSLVFIYNSLYPHASTGILYFFSGFMHILDKNLIRIQEHTIDIKRSLK